MNVPLDMWLLYLANSQLRGRSVPQKFTITFRHTYVVKVKIQATASTSIME